MANNSQYSLYANVPTIQMSRSRQNLSHHRKFTGNMGDIIPFYLQEIYPGDTFKVKSNVQVRLSQALSRPLLDNIFLDSYYFFVPHRLVFDHWEQVMGDNSKSSWLPDELYEFPTTEQSGQCVSGSVANSFGLPQGLLPKGIQLAPFRGFALVYNEWFRDQNTIDPVFVQQGATAGSEVININPWSENNYTGMLPKAAKFHDRFTSALPSPQKGTPITVSLGGVLPLDTIGESYMFGSGGNLSMAFDGTFPDTIPFNLTAIPKTAQGNDTEISADVNNPLSNDDIYRVKGTNMVADLSHADGITVNDLRMAFATQRLLERSAMYGTRYREILRAAFGVDSPDARLQIPEFLGGKREQLNISEVWQTSGEQTTNIAGLENALGSSAAYSKTNTSNGFTKSFVEHGYVIGVCVVRQHHNYTQGIEPFWSRKSRLDFYDPAFANIGLQPIYESELFAQDTIQLRSQEDNVFGYTEAWYDLRTRVNQVGGMLDPNAYIRLVDEDNVSMVKAGTGFDVFTLADNYDKAPTLSKEFLEETPIYLDRALVVDSESAPQFLFDFYHTVSAIRRIPVRSIPSEIGGGFR